MLTLLPDLTYPITSKQADALMNCMVKLNFMEAGLNERQQRGLAILLHVIDVCTKTRGKFDYRGQDGHRRLFDDSTSIAGSGLGRRLGDLPACHLALDWHDCQMRLKASGQPPISGDVNELLNQCRDLIQLSVDDETRVSLLLDYCSKRPLI